MVGYHRMVDHFDIRLLRSGELASRPCRVSGMTSAAAFSYIVIAYIVMALYSYGPI